MMLRSSPRLVDASECDLRQGDAEMVGEPLAAQGPADSATPARVAVPSPSHEFFVKGAVIEDGVDGYISTFPDGDAEVEVGVPSAGTTCWNVHIP